MYNNLNKLFRAKFGVLEQELSQEATKVTEALSLREDIEVIKDTMVTRESFSWLETSLPQLYTSTLAFAELNEKWKGQSNDVQGKFDDVNKVLKE